MKRFISLLSKIFFYIWELPQNIIGIILRLFIIGEQKREIAGITVWYHGDFPGGISLGNTIIVCGNYPFMAKHEYGHKIQSKILGPLYLLVIGIPSIIWAFLYGLVIPETPNGYYKFYTEKWADKLGKIER